MTAFVPAWKRLGLQLKNQNVDQAQHNETTDVSSRTESNQRSTENSKSHSENLLNESQRQNTSGRPAKQASEVHAQVQHTKEIAGPSSSKKRKSSEKGDPVNLPEALDKPGTSNGTSTIEKPKKQKQRNEETVDDTEEAIAFRHRRKHEIKRGRREVDSDAAQSQQSTEHRAYLDYLDQFHNDRSSWKFNKTSQTQLLRDILNVFRVPISYNAALQEYIKGLQSDAARARLSGMAQKELAKEPHEDAAQQRKRAEDVLEWIGGPVDAPTVRMAGKVTGDKHTSAVSSTRKRTRGRKRRQASISSSSDDDDSSSSSSESDSDDSST